MQIRINKYVSNCGLGSRRKVESLLWAGQILVNGKPAVPGQMIDTEKETVTYNKTKITPPIKKIYIALNKPVGYVSTASDERGRKKVLDLVKSKERLYPVGRLDKDSSGLILLTNDGDLALKLTHPRYHLPKTYLVTTREKISNSQLRRLSSGIEIQDKITLPAEVTRLSNTSFQIILHQGMKRQIREMCSNVHLTVETLHRIQIGPIKIGNLKFGESREIPREIIDQIITSAITRTDSLTESEVL